MNFAKQIRSGGKIAHSKACFNIVFDDHSGEYEYTLEYKDSSVIKEILKLDNEVLLERNSDGEGKIFANEIGRMMKFQAPVNEIAVATRQDKIQHPFLEPINKWADSLYSYKFGTDMGRVQLAVIDEQNSINEFDTHDQDAVVAISAKGQNEFGQEFLEDVTKDMNYIGFDIDSLEIDTPVGIKFNQPVGMAAKAIHVVERGVSAPIGQIALSQGMFRSISILIHLHYAVRTGNANTIVIDDIGEGLDYERSCRLIDCVMKLTNDSSVQLIMSTNDRFVMNVVPLESWTILKRDGDKVSVINKASHPDAFADFEFSGLPNFDFFRGATGGNSNFIGDEI